MTEAAEWQGRVGDAWAEEWRRTDRTLRPVGEALITAAEASLRGCDGPSILDVGCGAGSTTLSLADRLPGARLVGIDLSQALVAVARQRAEGRADLRFEEANASRWAPDDAIRFDAIISRHGVMFFADPVAAFTHLRGLGAPDVRLVFSCFRPRAENPWVLAFDPILCRFAPDALAGPPPATGPFAFGDRDRVASILTAAGFVDPRFEPLDFDFVVGEGDNPVAEAVAYFTRIGPFAALIRELDDGRRAAAIEQLTDIVAAHAVDGAVRLRGAIWLVTARSGS